MPSNDLLLLLPPVSRVLDAELEAVLLSKAAQLGLPADWVSLLDELDPERRQVGLTTHRQQPCNPGVPMSVATVLAPL